MNKPENPAVKLGALFSGGKDSTFAIFRAKEMGHEIACLITMHPAANDSLLFHYPNSWLTKYLSEAMEVQEMGFTVKGNSKDDETKALEEAISQAKSRFGLQGIVHGGIASNFQRRVFEGVFDRQGLAAVAPLWNIDQQDYMNELIRKGFKTVIVGVSAMGLDKKWLGKEIDAASLAELVTLSKKYGFNLSFEGGEAETLVTDCPLFTKKLQINAGTAYWDGQRGIFEIRDVSLVEK